MPWNLRTALSRGRLTLVLVLGLAGSAAPVLAAPEPQPAPDARLFHQRMLREAQREKGRATEPLELLEPADDDLDAAEARSRSAKRILRRSVRGYFGDRLLNFAETLPVLGRFLDRPTDSGPAAASGTDGVATGARRPDVQAAGEPPSARFGFRLDAHPRLTLRTRLYGFNGLVEIPVLDREVRVSFDRPLGNRGKAVLRGGLSAEDGSWATLSFNLRF